MGQELTKVEHRYQGNELQQDDDPKQPKIFFPNETEDINSDASE